MPDKSNVRSLLFLIFSGTLPSTIFEAKPSAIAVLPTPGSPIRQGLFFVLLLNICITLFISSSLPTRITFIPLFSFTASTAPFTVSTGA